MNRELVNNLKVNQIIFLNGYYKILNITTSKPGKGGAFYRIKAKNILSSKNLDRRFRSGEKLDLIHLHNQEVHYLYKTKDDYVFVGTNNGQEYTYRSKESIDIKHETNIKLLMDGERVLAIL